MYTTADLGKQEAALFEKMPVNGHVEQRDTFLKGRGLYEQWRDIYSKYVILAESGDIEALKRALFYAWYQLSEPSWLSGIDELPDSETSIVVSALEKALGDGLDDQELAYMLPYYMVVCSYYLERFYPLPNIQRASAGSTGNERSIAEGSDVNWDKRGRMGMYWG